MLGFDRKHPPTVLAVDYYCLQNVLHSQVSLTAVSMTHRLVLEIMCDEY